MTTGGFPSWIFVTPFFAIIATTIVAGLYWGRSGPSGTGRHWDGPFVGYPFVPLVYPFKILWYYSLNRSKLPPPESVPRRTRAAGTLAIAGVTSIVVAAVVAPPDPFTTVRYMAIGYPIGAGLGYLLTSVEVSGISDAVDGS